MPILREIVAGGALDFRAKVRFGVVIEPEQSNIHCNLRFKAKMAAEKTTAIKRRRANKPSNRKPVVQVTQVVSIAPQP
jgi:hypothetical protein